MGSASHWMLSHTAVSVRRATVAPCATNKASCLIPAGACPANMVAARSQTQEAHTVTVKAATPGNCATQVGLCFVIPRMDASKFVKRNSNLHICLILFLSFKSQSVEGSLCEISIRCSEGTPSAKQRAWSPGWSAAAPAARGRAAAVKGWNAGNTPSSAAMEPLLVRKWKRPSSVAAWGACSPTLSHHPPLLRSRKKGNEKGGIEGRKERKGEDWTKTREGKQENRDYTEYI